jgi:cbb3-type cytochrome oxidase subunit 3
MKGFFSSFELTVWPQVTLVLFMVIFVSVTAWVLRPSGKQEYTEASHLPLDENDDLGDK